MTRNLTRNPSVCTKYNIFSITKLLEVRSKGKRGREETRMTTMKKKSKKSYREKYRKNNYPLRYR